MGIFSTICIRIHILAVENVFNFVDYVIVASYSLTKQIFMLSSD